MKYTLAGSFCLCILLQCNAGQKNQPLTKKNDTTQQTEQKKSQPAPQPVQPAAKAVTPVSTKIQATSRTIKVANNISDKSLSYKYGFISYSPSSFDLKVNGSKIERKESQQVTAKDNKITIRYDYEFLGGKRKGAKEVVFDVPADINELSLNFSWHDDAHVLIDNVKPLSVTKIY